MQGQWCWYH